MDAGQARGRLEEIGAGLLPLLQAAFPAWVITQRRNGAFRAHRRGCFPDDQELSGSRFALFAGSAAELWVQLDFQETIEPTVAPCGAAGGGVPVLPGIHTGRNGAL